MCFIVMESFILGKMFSFVMFLRVCGKVSVLIVLLYNFQKTKSI